MISGGFLDRRDWVHPPIQRYWLLQSRHLIVCSMWPRCVTCVILLHQKAAGSQLTLAPIGAPTTLRRRLKQRNYSRPNGVTIRSQGTKAPVRTLVAQDRRSPSTTRRMSRIAKGSYCRARCSQKQALAQIAKSGGLLFRSELPAVLAGPAGGVDANAGAFSPE
jgi:hypothetical protein